MDKTLNKILNELEREFKDQGVERQQIRDIIYLYFRNAADVMADKRLPSVVFPKFATMLPLIKRMQERAERDVWRGEDDEWLQEVIRRRRKEHLMQTGFLENRLKY